MWKNAALTLVFLVSVYGCAKRDIIKSQEQIMSQPVAKETTDEPSVRSKDWSNVPQLKIVYFDFDSAELRPDCRETLKRNAEYLKSNSNLTVLVEGHCDERGTTEYNLALGQRRASRVRDYYSKLGIPLKRIATISYGEERPLDPNHSEAAWAKNRRADTKVKKTK